MATEVLDVTKIEPKFKHPTIFDHFNALKEGEAFIIKNDHDPKPLYYQLKAERGDIFDWEYLENGPEWWQIKLSKKVLNENPEEANHSLTVGELAGKDVRNAEIFNKYGLEFCCDGQKSLEESCADAGVSVETVKAELDTVPDTAPAKGQDYANWDLDFLADYIVNVHHKYVTDAVPMLTDLSQLIAKVHGDAHPELFEIKEHVNTLLSKMVAHQKEEETVLFPFIKELVNAKKEGRKPNETNFGEIEDPVAVMLHDHKGVADHIHAIDDLSKNYEVPADGCESYKLYYHKLKELDEDLHHHIHLENNVLFPKGIKLQKAQAN